MIHRIEQTIVKGYKEKIIAGNPFELKEDASSARCKKGRFKRTKDILVYKFDKVIKYNGTVIKDKFPFFQSTKSIKSMCDFILFYPTTDTTTYVILCNLKSDNKSNSADQFEAAKIFAKFIIETVKRCHKEELQHIKIEYRNVLFSSTLLYKGTTKPSRHNSAKFRNYVSNEFGCDTCDLDIVCN